MRNMWNRAVLCILMITMSGAALTEPFAFRDVAQTSGLTVSNYYGGFGRKDYILETTGNGVAIFDYDGDGRNDIFIANGTRLHPEAGAGEHPPNLYHNDGNGRFTEVGQKAGFTTGGWAQGVCVGDFNNDGRPDLFITYYGHNRLYQNQGDGTFRDVTVQAKLPTTGTRYGSGCSFVDYDRDGHLDLVVANYVDLDLAKTPHPGTADTCQWKGLPVMCGPRGLPLAHNILYHNNGDNTFSDVSEAAGILKPGGRYGLGVVAADFDNDGWPDLYIACDMTASLLFHNRHDGTFEERALPAGVAYNFDGQLQAGMGVAVADFDGDGLLDIAKTNFSGDLTSLFKNEDGKFFTDVSREAGLGVRQLLGWGIAFGDFDEDGWPDLMIANGHVYPEVDGAGVGDQYRQPTVLFRNLGNGKFSDVTGLAGPAFQTPRPARGLAIGDLTGDGRLAAVIVNMNEPPSLLVNGGPRQNWVSLTLRGTKSNRSAIGARASLTAGGRTRIAEVMSGGSYYSQNDLTLHFGLGSRTAIDGLVVRWPDGHSQTWKQLLVNRRLLLTEDDPSVIVRK